MSKNEDDTRPVKIDPFAGMTPLRIEIDATQTTDGKLFIDNKDGTIRTGRLMAIGGMPKGMGSSKASLAMSIKLENGEQVFAETSMTLFLLAAKVLREAYEHEQEQLTVEGKTMGQLAYEAFKLEDSKEMKHEKDYPMADWDLLDEAVQRKWEAAGRQVAGVMGRQVLGEFLKDMPPGVVT